MKTHQFHLKIESRWINKIVVMVTTPTVVLGERLSLGARTKMLVRLLCAKKET
nr:MAG: hypothetical protein 2 [Betanecrovirus sp.]